jgi:MYXO-CTERM domain-containing protein
MKSRFLARNLRVASLLAALALVQSSTAATTLMSTNFQSHAAGPATVASLDAATTGGFWSLNGFRNSGAATYEIQLDGSGDKALMLDDNTNGNAGKLSFVTITLNTAAGFATDAVTLTTATAARRTGTNKSYVYEFLGTGGMVGARITWSHGGDVSFNNGAATGSASFTGLFPWDSSSTAVHGVSAVFSGGNVVLSLGSANSGTLSLLNGVTSFSALRVFSDGSNSAARGLFLDDITVTQVPEPAAALLGSLGLLALLRRRRQQR